MKRKPLYFTLFFIVGTILFLISSPVYADNTGGGQASVEGRITFQEESTDKNNKANHEDSTAPLKGKLPNTGELIQYTSLSGGIVLLSFLYFLKKKRQEGE